MTEEISSAAPYYPDAPFRRFWFMRDRLAIAPSPEVPPGQTTSSELFEQHALWAEEAGKEIPVDEPGVFGFVYGTDDDLTATIRWKQGDVVELARDELQRWAAEQEPVPTLGFDEFFA